ncbi:ABC transporter substrate-binding protein [Natrinema salifodinae]|uniref:Ferrichrome-binding protein n=1 Tax=Natrinema salifodinae TaxID=1202768 RepID=A0A1I0QDD2_9EURY|nr:ABC transporter substrate-binding protein [Natrinema salifodinae]SEW24899.1 ferrichrome-binding protein [Natrinema salifodinae]
MTDERTWTRRNVLRTSGAIAGVGAMAGCLDSLGSSGDEIEYTVSMPPVGEVGFPGVPETWATGNGTWADMGIALGQEPPGALWLTSRFHTQYYDEIPDVSVSKEGMVDLYEDGVDVEKFYDIDADLHVMDPNFMTNRYDSIDESDVEDIEQIGPIFGNTIFSRDYAWHDDYEYLTLYEAFGKLAEVFQEEERYEAFSALHDEFQSRVDEIVPPEDDRPEVAILWPMGEGEFLPYTIDEGTSFKQWRDLGVRDALAEANVSDFHDSRGRIDYENVLEIDPEIILFRGNEQLTADEFQEQVVAEMEDHNVASELKAVKNGDVYRGGPLHQGPIINLIMTERAARQVYDVDDELFDRQKVSDIVTGDF